MTMTTDDLRDARLTLAHSQQAMADLLGVGRATYQRWELGKHRIPHSVSVHVDALLNVTIVSPNDRRT